MSTHQLGLESVLELEPQVVGLWHRWIRTPGSHPNGSGPGRPRHPHHGGVSGVRHPLQTHVWAHGGGLEAAIGGDAAVPGLSAVVLAVHERLHVWIRRAQVLVLVRQRSLEAHEPLKWG